LKSEWISASPYNLQSDIFQVYQKALFHSATIYSKSSNEKFIEASSFPNSIPIKGCDFISASLFYIYKREGN